MKVLKYILGIAVFAKVESLVQVPYVEPSLLGCLNVKSKIPWSHGIQRNDMNNVMCYMNCYMWYVLCEIFCVVFKIISLMMHIILMAWLCKSKFCRSMEFPDQNLAGPLTWLSINHVVKKDLFFLIYVLGMYLHIPIITTSMY